jgi:nicotinamide-nucleotide amidase
MNSRVLHTIGITESELNNLLKEFMNLFPKLKLVFISNMSGVSLQLSIISEFIDECDVELNSSINYCYEKIGKYIYGQDDTTIEKVVADLLVKEGLKIAVAESCTGGLVSHKLTNIPGSSKYFECGFVVYSNTSKIDLLGIELETIEKYGAVSAEIAVSMARSVLHLGKTDIGISTTGIAGPGGGTLDKPVGTLHIGYADKNRSFSEKYQFVGERVHNKECSAVSTLNLLRRILLNQI